MALLRDLATKRPLRHAVGDRVVVDGYFITGAAGAVSSSEFPAGYSVARTATGTYVLTCPTGFHLAFVELQNAHSLHKVQVVDTSGAGTQVSIKTATLSVATVTTNDQGPPVTSVSVSTPVYTVADISGLIIQVLVISKE